MTARPLCLLLVAAACYAHPADSTPVLASATIGPEGGVLVISSGAQAGLQLTVPPGALAAPTEVRIRDMSALPEHGTSPPPAMQMPNPPPFPVPGKPFRIEPAGLQLAAPATLRAPYDVSRMLITAPGNVRAREVRNDVPIEHVPEVVDVARGFIEFPIGFFSQYTVVRGPIAQDVGAYLGTPGEVVPLADGWTFAIEVVSNIITRWRITGPGGENLLYFLGNVHNGDDALAGRESVTDDWRETWNNGYEVWTPATRLPPPQSMTIPTLVQRPMSAPPVGGSITVFGSRSWSDPQQIAGQMLYDVLSLRVTLAWVRNDLGVGQREYVFWFAPVVGLIGLAEDGLLHVRTSL